jgi:hypothetical protein
MKKSNRNYLNFLNDLECKEELGKIRKSSYENNSFFFNMIHNSLIFFMTKSRNI